MFINIFITKHWIGRFQPRQRIRGLRERARDDQQTRSDVGRDQQPPDRTPRRQFPPPLRPASHSSEQFQLFAIDTRTDTLGNSESRK